MSDNTKIEKSILDIEFPHVIMEVLEEAAKHNKCSIQDELSRRLIATFNHKEDIYNTIQLHSYREELKPE